MRLAGLAALLGALVVAAAAGAAGLPSSDEFADPAVTAAGWKQMDGDLRDGVRPRFDVGGTTAGQLTIVPGLSWWIDDSRAFYLYKAVRGERKTTVQSRSELVLAAETPGWVQLRIARVGPRFVLLRRYPGSP